jgi:hypothetical protein
VLPAHPAQTKLKPRKATAFTEHLSFVRITTSRHGVTSPLHLLITPGDIGTFTPVRQRMRPAAPRGLLTANGGWRHPERLRTLST